MKQVFAVLAGVLIASSAWAGTAFYGGYTGETGTLFGFNNVPVAPESISWVGHEGFYSIDATSGAGRVKFQFTLNDGTTILTIPDGTTYDVTGYVINPGSGLDPVNRNYRFFLGPTTFAQNLGHIGLEWNVAQGQWVLASDNNALVGNNTNLGDDGAVAIPANWSTFAVKASRDASANLILEFAVDGGAWRPFWVFDAIQAPLSANNSGTISKAILDAYNADAGGPDTPYVSIRGTWPFISEMVITGSGVTDVNTPQTPIDINGDADADGISLVLEVKNGLNPLVSNVGSDLDGDGVSDVAEVVTYGLNPKDSDSNNDGYSDKVAVALFPENTGQVITASMLPLFGLGGLGLLGLGLAAAGFRRIRK
ncbi:MAG TPA: hypothetical protein PLO62_06940 [Candidatus Hydrogenedentes bacterium]|nr:hypothetical protein [Candidatus Hydrogenedentota bacterium]